jgi:2-aminoadipate transaminase
LAPGAIALTGGFPGADVLPVAELDQAFHAALAAPDAPVNALQYHGPFGTDELRAWIAADQGTEPENVLVTNGALHSVAFVVEALVDPGDLVVVESPTYPFALRLLRYFGAALASVPTDADGFDVDRFEVLLRSGARPKAVYLIPDFQNPSGVTLSGERRERLLELAENFGFVIISDNPYTKLRFADAEIPEFPAGHPNVALANTFSKILGPGLRLGWLIAPDWLRHPALRFRLSLDQHANLLTQRAITRILRDEPTITGIVARARAVYRKRSEVLLDALRAELGGRLVAERPEGGLFLWARIPGIDAGRVLDIARAKGLDFTVGSSFDPDPARAGFGDHVRFAYSNATEADLREAASRFAAAVAAT